MSRSSKQLLGLLGDVQRRLAALEDQPASVDEKPWFTVAIIDLTARVVALERLQTGDATAIAGLGDRLGALEQEVGDLAVALEKAYASIFGPVGGSDISQPPMPVSPPPAPSVVLSGTVLAAPDEADFVAGGLTIILTLNAETWLTAGAAFDAQRQPIIDGLVSDGAEANGFNAERSNIAVTDIVRTSNEVATLTLPALSAYDISVAETTTATVPASAVTISDDPLVAPQTFTSTPIIALSPDFFIAAAGDDTGPGTQGSPWKTLGKIETYGASPGFSPSVVIGLNRGDTWAESLTLPSSSAGVEGSHSILTGYGTGVLPIIDGGINADNRDYITCDRLRFEFDGSGFEYWINSGYTVSTNLTIQSCTFDASAEGGFRGIRLRATDNIIIRACHWTNWGSNCLDILGGKGLLFELCNLHKPASQSTHGIFNIFADDMIIRDNQFRNEFDRVAEIEKRTYNPGNSSGQQIFDPGHGGNVLVENNVFFDSDYDTVQTAPAHFTGNLGVDGIMKFNVTKGIFRNNISAGHETGSNANFAAAVNMSGYGNADTSGLVDTHENIRIYHCIFIGNPNHHAIAVLSNHTPANTFDDDLRIFNNIMMTGREFCMFFFQSGGSPPYISGGWKIDFNYCEDDVSDDGTQRTLASMNSLYAAAWGSSNIQGTAPTFVGPGTVASHKAADTAILFPDLVLAAASVGENAGEPSTLVDGAHSALTTLTVDDAYVFFPGVPGVGVTGDKLRIINSGGDVITTVTARPTATTLTVDPAVTCDDGDPVYLHKYGHNSAPSLGIIDPDAFV